MKSQPAASARSICSSIRCVESADNMMLYKYIVNNVANQYGKTVTFMPKPLFEDNGSGMHTHQSFGKTASPCSPATAMPD